MKRAIRVCGWGLAVGLGVALLVAMPVRMRMQTTEADNSYKLITLRGSGLASVPFAFNAAGILFSTAAADTTDYPNARAEQRRSMRGPLVCWSRLDRLISVGYALGVATSGSPFVSVFIQHAADDLESAYSNLMYLSSANRTVMGTGFSTALAFSTSAATDVTTVGVTSLISDMRVADSLAVGAVTTGAFGRYLRARLVMTPTTTTIDSQVGVPITIQCELSGDSILR